MFNIPIDNITLQDIEQSLKSGVREDILLDFKEDFPKKLDKTISSMANTYGGMVALAKDAFNRLGIRSAQSICRSLLGRNVLPVFQSQKLVPFSRYTPQNDRRGETSRTRNSLPIRGLLSSLEAVHKNP